MIELDTREFNDTLRRLSQATGRQASSTVRFWGRKLLRKLAYNTPIAKGKFALRGRLRAGWWPAASALGVSNVYTSQPNKKEGGYRDNLAHASNPSFTMTNSVPFIPFVKGIESGANKALAEAQAGALKELEGDMRRAWNGAGGNV